MSFKITKNTFNNKAVEATVRAAIGVFADTAAKRMEAEAKDPPYPENPKQYSEKEIILFKTLAKKRKLKKGEVTKSGVKYRWKDRTGNARNSIQGSFGWKGNRAVITLSGNMEYSVYLELANEKKYAVLMPTIERNAPEVIKGYRRIF